MSLIFKLYFSNYIFVSIMFKSLGLYIYVCTMYVYLVYGQFGHVNCLKISVTKYIYSKLPSDIILILFLNINHN